MTGVQTCALPIYTLQPERFEALTRSRALPQVREGIEAASRVFAGLKLDAVILRGTNEDELVPLIEYAREIGAELRFIEYMDVGGATRWSMAHVVSRHEMLEALRRHYGAIEQVAEQTSAPADRYRLPDGTAFGIISSTTEPFCRSCDRSRLTADGLWYLCLYAAQGIDLRGPLRAGASANELHDLIVSRWKARDDRGAEERLALRNREPFIPLKTLKADPHLEMHTRGG